jgi:hypothetical protein
VNGETPLAIAVKRLSANWAYDDTINYFVENTSADVTKGVVDLAGEKTNALNLLLKRGYTHMAKLLVRHGASVDNADSKGHFPLYSALHNLESTKFFLDTFPAAAHQPITTSGTTMLGFIFFGGGDAPLEVFKELVSRKVVDIVGGKVEGKTALQWFEQMDATWGDTYRHFKRIYPYLLYERDKQRLTELCKVYFLAEKQRATVCPHTLKHTCGLSADLFEELSEYLAPKDVVEKPKRPRCECGYC